MGCDDNRENEGMYKERKRMRRGREGGLPIWIEADRWKGKRRKERSEEQWGGADDRTEEGAPRWCAPTGQGAVQKQRGAASAAGGRLKTARTAAAIAEHVAETHKR